MARIIAIANVKGGVGKTTTSLNLAAALGERSCRVLAIDLDPQASLTVSVGLDPDVLVRTIRNSLDPDAAPLSLAIIATSDKFDLVPSNHELRTTEKNLDKDPNGLFNLQRALDPISARYDYILLDCPANAGVLTGLALAAAHEVIVPLTTDYLTLQAFGWLWNIVQETQRRINPNLVISGILLNMYDPRTRHAREITAAIQAQYGSQVAVLPVTVHNSVRIKEAPLAHQSILRFAPKSDAAEAFRSLAVQIEKGLVESSENALVLALSRGRKALAAHNMREAYAAFRRATEINPAVVEAWMGRAETAEEWDEEIRCLDEAVRLDPSNNDMRTRLEWLLNEWTMTSPATDAPRMLALGYYLESNAEQKYAEQILRRACELMPSNREASLALARTAGNPEEAVALARSLLKRNAQDSEAQAALRQAEARIKQNAQQLVNRGIATAHDGNKGQAALLFEQATELDPANDRAWVGRAQTTLDWRSAFQYVKRALEINPDNEEARRLYRLVWMPEEKNHKWSTIRGILIAISLLVVIISLMIAARFIIPSWPNWSGFPWNLFAA